MRRFKILFVCLGNICRSPTSEAIFRQIAQAAGFDVEIDSAGTSGWHNGELPDARSREYGEARGYSFAGQHSRAVTQNDFTYYDLILGMDAKNIQTLQDMCPQAQHHKIKLFLDYAPHLSIREVPDPYYRGNEGFIEVIGLIEAASVGLLAVLKDT